MIFKCGACFKNGKKQKSAIVYFDAKNETEAQAAFGRGCYYDGYPDTTGFYFDEVESAPKNVNVVKASEVRDDRVGFWEGLNEDEDAF